MGIWRFQKMMKFKQGTLSLTWQFDKCDIPLQINAKMSWGSCRKPHTVLAISKISDLGPIEPKSCHRNLPLDKCIKFQLSGNYTQNKLVITIFPILGKWISISNSSIFIHVATSIHVDFMIEILLPLKHFFTWYCILLIL